MESNFLAQFFWCIYLWIKLISIWQASGVGWGWGGAVLPRFSLPPASPFPLPHVPFRTREPVRRLYVVDYFKTHERNTLLLKAFTPFSNWRHSVYIWTRKKVGVYSKKVWNRNRFNRLRKSNRRVCRLVFFSALNWAFLLLHQLFDYLIFSNYLLILI